MKSKTLVNRNGYFERKKINEDYPTLKKLSRAGKFEFFNLLREQQLIQEFLYTVNIDKTISNIKKINNKLLIKKVSNINSKSFDTIEIIFYDNEYENEVTKRMLMLGWYPSSVTVKGKYKKYSGFNFKDLDNFSVFYEPKYDVEVEINNKKLFHISPDVYRIQINNIGLTLKTQSKLSNHPQRIYLTSNIHDLDNLAFNLWKSSKFKNQEIVYHIYKVHTDSLKNHKFFIDPNYDGGYFTYDNIPPSSIHIIDSIYFTP